MSDFWLGFIGVCIYLGLDKIAEAIKGNKK